MLTKKYGIEISGFDFMGYDPDEGEKPLAHWDLWLSYDEKKRDHAPAIHFYLELFGFIVVDFGIYNVNHATT